MFSKVEFSFILCSRLTFANFNVRHMTSMIIFFDSMDTYKAMFIFLIISREQRLGNIDFCCWTAIAIMLQALFDEFSNEG